VDIAGVLAMYREGWFPMEEGGKHRWVRPRTRWVLPLDGSFRVPRSLRAKVSRGVFEVKADTGFERVIRACAQPRPGRESTWLSAEIIRVFLALRVAGHAHSVEAWKDGELVGGLYGLALGGAFCGESMFSRPELGGTDASKVCLVKLVGHLRARGFTLLDAQLHNPHLEQFGLRAMSDAAYRSALLDAARARVAWGVFGADG
jgi:leucyl/phenylalanyl-tRNA--protein transferase